MNAFAAQRAIDKAKRESADPGEMPQSVIDELVLGRTAMKQEAQDYADAIEMQATKYRLKKGALKKYINAIEADKLAETREEVAALADLIG